MTRAEPESTREALLLEAASPQSTCGEAEAAGAVGGSGPALFRLPAGPRCPQGSLRNASCTKPGLAGAQTPPVAGGRSSQCLPTAALPRNEEDRRSGELRDGGGGPGDAAGRIEALRVTRRAAHSLACPVASLQENKLFGFTQQLPVLC